MPNLLVRGVPDEVHAALLRKAQRTGQSLQQYLTRELTRLAVTPSVDEVLAGVEQHQGGAVGLARAVDDLRELRAST